MSGNCPPDYGNSNPCDGAQPSLIREKGRPGSPGVPGGTPVFQVGTVVNGGSPSVTYTMVNPLLYRVDYVLPSAGLADLNEWTALQTFLAGIATVGITDTGTATLNILVVGGAAEFNGATEFNGAVTFNSSATFAAGLTAEGQSVMQDLAVNGVFIVPGPQSLAAGEVYMGYAVLDSCGRLKITNGVGPNIENGGNNFTQVVAFDAPETAIALTLPFTVPSVAECGVAPNSVISVYGQLQASVAGAIPTDISDFTYRIRLDNAVTGQVLYASVINNFQSGQNFNFVAANTAPGAHTLYFTIQGLAGGSSSITLTALECTVTF